GRELAPWHNDRRFRQILGDTRDVRGIIDSGVDLLFIDSGTEHVYSLISAEWRLYESCLTDRAIVVCDDIRVNDMPRFWDELPYEKMDVGGAESSGFGVFQYVRGDNGL